MQASDCLGERMQRTLKEFDVLANAVGEGHAEDVAAAGFV